MQHIVTEKCFKLRKLVVLQFSERPLGYISGKFMQLEHMYKSM